METIATVDKINEALDAYLQNDIHEVLWEAMQYSVFAGGKRLRPRLLLAACSGMGGNSGDAMPFACAVEMIHTYSLIHDDLPDLDDDDLRRGQPTCHVKYGPAMAILAGDALLNLAYEVMCGACAKNPAHIGAMSAIARAAGARGMVAGQAADILSENKTIDESELLYIHANKTGALIKACLEAGGIVGGAGPDRQAKLSEIGGLLGRAFQIRDDLMDVTFSTEELGKPAMSDIKNNKSTYISVFGLECAKRDCEALTSRAVELIGDGLGLKDAALIGLAGRFRVN